VDIYWVEQAQSDVPVYDEWLAEGELRCLERLHIPKRRDDWRLGRWTAKRAVATVLGLPQDDNSLTNIEIPAGSSGAPKVYVGHQPASVSVSLSHRDGVAACAAAQSTIALGCDLELIETRSDAFVGDYFTAEEQATIARAHASERDQLVTTLWSAKESALKALQVGLRVDTRSVGICLCGQNPKWGEQSTKNGSELFSRCYSPEEWRPFQATFENDQVLYGWWNTSASLVKTFATFQPAKPPIFVNPDTFHYSP
jgi:4'-phosphopantetheinyl transferase